MLSQKPWTWDAIARLVLSGFICLCLGSLAVNTIHYQGAAGAVHWAFLVMAAIACVLLVTSLVLIAKTWPLQDLFRPLLLLLVCLASGLTLVASAQKLSNLPQDSKSGEQMVIAETAVLVFFICFLRARRIKWSDAFGFRHNRGHAILAGVMVACIFLPIAEGLQWASYHFMTHMRLEPQEQEAVRVLRVTNAWANRLVLAALALFLAPVVEEIFFRGMLYPAIKQAGFPRLAVWGVSLLFALVHFNLVSFVPLFVLAILLTALYEYTDNLLAPISAHALFNALNFAMLYLFEKQFGR